MIFVLIQIVIVLLIVGIIFWLIQSFVPIPPPIKNIVYVVIVLILLLYLLRVLGILRM